MNHGGYVRYGPHNMADTRPDKNNNGHYGMMIQVRRYFHISSDCCEFSWGVKEGRGDFVLMYDTWLEMHVWTVT